jgi:hypothetical protein
MDAADRITRKAEAISPEEFNLLMDALNKKKEGTALTPEQEELIRQKLLSSILSPMEPVAPVESSMGQPVQAALENPIAIQEAELEKKLLKELQTVK